MIRSRSGTWQLCSIWQSCDRAKPSFRSLFDDNVYVLYPRRMHVNVTFKWKWLNRWVNVDWKHVISCLSLYCVLFKEAPYLNSSSCCLSGFDCWELRQHVFNKASLMSLTVRSQLAFTWRNANIQPTCKTYCTGMALFERKSRKRVLIQYFNRYPICLYFFLRILISDVKEAVKAVCRAVILISY